MTGLLLKFRVYQFTCWAVLTILSYFLVFFILEMSRETTTIDNPFLSFFLFFLFIFLYASLPVSGLILLGKVQHERTVSKLMIYFPRVLVFLLLPIQLFIFYHLPETFRDIQKAIMILQRAHLYRTTIINAVMEGLLILLATLTLYLELFTFPLTKLAKNITASVFREIEEIGNNK